MPKTDAHTESLDFGSTIVTATSDNVMTIDELAIYLKVSKSTLYKLAQEGKVPGQKVGRHWRFHSETIDGWLSDRDVREQDSEDL